MAPMELAVKPHLGGRPAGAGLGNRMIPLTIRLEKALEQRARTSHLKPALAPLYKAASAASSAANKRAIKDLFWRDGIGPNFR